MIIGRVVVDDKSQYEKYFNDRFLLTDVYEECDIPTLIIGFSKAKFILGTDLNILNRVHKNKLYWTFLENEEYYLSRNDVIDFVTHCYKNILIPIKYNFIDPFIIGEERYEKFFKYIEFECDRRYVNEDMVYYVVDENVIYGVNRRFDSISYNKLSNDIINTEIKNDYSDFSEYIDLNELHIAFLESI